MGEGWGEGGGAEQPALTAEAPRRRLQETGANPVPLRGGKKKGGGHLLTKDFLICSEASAPSGLAFLRRVRSK